MDVALCQEILRLAEQAGANKAFVLSRSCIQSIDRISNLVEFHTTKVLNTDELFVTCGNGCCSEVIYQNERAELSRDDLISHVKKCCQAARLAHVWGQNSNIAETEFKHFDSQSASADIVDNSCLDIHKKNACNVECFRPQCLMNADFSAISALKNLRNNLADVNEHISLDAEISIQAIEETRYFEKNIQTQRHYESCLKQTLFFRHLDNLISLKLPDFRFLGRRFELSEHPEFLSAQDVADGFSKSASSVVDYVNPSDSILISGWGMCVLGHEAAHLKTDITRGGRIVLNMAECLDFPVHNRLCAGNGIKISLEGGLTREELLTRVADKTLMVDAPDAWVRKNESILEVRFRIVCSVRNGVPDQYYKPVVLRFDLKKMWYYCKFASKPYVRIAMACGEGIADFQAPWGYFDLKPVLSHW